MVYSFVCNKDYPGHNIFAGIERFLIDQVKTLKVLHIAKQRTNVTIMIQQVATLIVIMETSLLRCYTYFKASLLHRKQFVNIGYFEQRQLNVVMLNTHIIDLVTIYLTLALLFPYKQTQIQNKIAMRCLVHNLVTFIFSKQPEPYV